MNHIEILNNYTNQFHTLIKYFDELKNEVQKHLVAGTTIPDRLGKELETKLENNGIGATSVTLEVDEQTKTSRYIATNLEGWVVLHAIDLHNRLL